MLSRAGEVKVIDYGLAWIKGEAKDRVQGTPEYMAPETVRSKVINERTDIYNFGATMYRLVTHKLPPSAAGSTDSMRLTEKTWRTLVKPVSDLNPSVPAELASLIDRSLAFNADKRPQRMDEVRGVLGGVAEGLGEPVDE